jgi:hypothetical protein
MATKLDLFSAIRCTSFDRARAASGERRPPFVIATPHPFLARLGDDKQAAVFVERVTIRAMCAVDGARLDDEGPDIPADIAVGDAVTLSALSAALH